MLSVMPSVPDSVLPRYICQRLVDFASRMPEVKDATQRGLMEDALFELRKNVARLVAGVELDADDRVPGDGEGDLRATVALLEETFPLTEETLGTLRNVGLAIDSLFEGVEFGGEPPCSQYRVRRTD